MTWPFKGGVLQMSDLLYTELLSSTQPSPTGWLQGEQNLLAGHTQQPASAGLDHL
jgi:hypothetical protein